MFEKLLEPNGSSALACAGLEQQLPLLQIGTAWSEQIQELQHKLKVLQTATASNAGGHQS